MKNTALKVVLFASVLAPMVVYGQSGPTTATIITKQMIDTINKQEQDRATDDENAMVVDLGYEHFSVGVIHRGSTRNPPPAPAAGGARAAAPPPTPCGRQVASVPADALPGGITHDHQTEAYYIISGGGTAFVDGYIVNGRASPMPAPGGPNGPTCGGASVGSHKVELKVGDIMIAPPNTVHGWWPIFQTVADYLSFRPSQRIDAGGLDQSAHRGDGQSGIERRASALSSGRPARARNAPSLGEAPDVKQNPVPRKAASGVESQADVPAWWDICFAFRHGICNSDL